MFTADLIGARRAGFSCFKGCYTLLLLLVTLTLAGCGDIEWFPPYERLGTTPDAFSFEAKTGQTQNVSVTSNEITVSGLTAATSPISITGTTGSNSKYSINGGAAADTEGTVKNGDKVTVTHTTATTPGTTMVSTLTIGNVSANFTSTTALVAPLTFTTPTQSGGYMQTYATITSVDGVSGTHEIKIKSMKDGVDTGGAEFAVVNSTEPPVIFNSTTTTFSLLNNRRIYVRNLLANVNAGAVTTLTIDGVDTIVTLKAP